MSVTRTIGKNTIGDNNKMKVHMKTYDRSTHDMSYIWRNTQSPGTLVPFMCEVGLVGDTWEIDLDANVLTHPTVGPLFGSFKLQNDIYTVPLRLYNSWLHNNRLNIGMKMSQVMLPQIKVDLSTTTDVPKTTNEFPQINPSCLLAYLGLRGYGKPTTAASVYKNAVPLIGYYDIFKNYYANKQETNFYRIEGGLPILGTLKGAVSTGGPNINSNVTDGMTIAVYTKAKKDVLMIEYSIDGGSYNERMAVPISDFGSGNWTATTSAAGYGTGWEHTVNYSSLEANKSVTIWGFYNKSDGELISYPLEDIDKMRDKILLTAGNVRMAITTTDTGVPNLYKKFVQRDETGILNTSKAQFGLCTKTYQSDLYQNWINTDWITGANGINEVSAVSTAGGSFTMDALNLAKKVYDMLNRIAVSGGTYKDWIETVYSTDYIERSETPVFEGGMSREIAFQEVVSNSASANEPLGTLAGRGTLVGKQKGGKIKIRCTEPCYIIGITSITPRIDYNQGNRFDSNFRSIDDLHKPQLDGIGYQDLVTEGMAYWDTLQHTGGTVKYAAGKTVAWIDYMTNVNRTFGNFAINNNEAFMVLNRNYEMNETTGRINDLTTYIDPKKYNYIFADKSIDAMNFWVQLGVDAKVRRVMSAKVIPNL